MDDDVLQILLGFLGTAVVLGALVFVVGVSDLLAAFGLLDPSALGLIVVTGLAWLGAWSLGLRRVLLALDIRVSAHEAGLLYASAVFANNITPFGQAGGEPFSALLISRATDSEYEQGLAAIASVDTLNFVPSISLALLGLAYYVARFTVGNRIRFIIAVVVGLAVGVPLLGYMLWTARDRLRPVVVTGLNAVFEVAARVIPRLEPPDPASIGGRIMNFYSAIGRVATGRGNILAVVGYSTLGWLMLCLTLWLSLSAIGSPVPAMIVIVVVPVGTIAGIAPLPGGAGGVEAATVLLLVPTTGISAATAGAAAILYRGATYWLPTVLGGIATAWLQGRTSA